MPKQVKVNCTEDVLYGLRLKTGVIKWIIRELKIHSEFMVNARKEVARNQTLEFEIDCSDFVSVTCIEELRILVEDLKLFLKIYTDNEFKKYKEYRDAVRVFSEYNDAVNQFYFNYKH